MTEHFDRTGALDDAPARAACERPDTSTVGGARISGHGVATTTKATVLTGSPLRIHAKPATNDRGRKEEACVAVRHPCQQDALRLGGSTRRTSAEYALSLAGRLARTSNGAPA